MRRKHKKFIDPRYFMNEKAEMPQYDDEYDEQDAPYDTEAEAGVATTNSASTNKKVLYAAAKKQIEEVLNTLWDDLDAGGVPSAQAELNKLMAQIQKDMDAGFVGEPT